MNKNKRTQTIEQVKIIKAVVAPLHKKKYCILTFAFKGFLVFVIGLGQHPHPPARTSTSSSIYPAAKSVPSRVARVPAADVREARRVRATPDTAAARPAAKRPPPESERGADGCKKAKRTSGRGISMDALRRYMEEVKAQYPDAELAPTRMQD